MVLPWPIVEAAETGDVAAVRDWLVSGGDANDTDDDGDETLLTTVIMAGRDMSDAHLDLARLLLETVRTSINPQTGTHLALCISVPLGWRVIAVTHFS